MKNSDTFLLEYLGMAIEKVKNNGSKEDIDFYNALRTAIELKDSSPLKELGNSDINFNNQDKESFDFFVDLQRVTKEASSLNFDLKFDLNESKSYAKHPLFSTLALAINIMLEEIEYKIMPKHYFSDIFSLLETPALLTNIYGKVLSVSNNWKNDFEHVEGIEIHKVIPEATKAMCEAQNVANEAYIKNATIISKDGTSKKGYNLQVKHLFNYEEKVVQEGFLFICSKDDL